ncbi:insulinase family protein [bacterium]|nr:insulinase family protein [bacterium]
MNKLNRTIAPAFHEIDSINFVLPTIKKLDNNVPYIEYNAGTEELVKIDFVFKAGTKYQTKALVASMTNAMLKEGTNSFNSLEIANKIDFYGAFFETDINSDYATVSLYSLNKHLTNVLPVIKEVLTNVSFPQAEFDKKIKIKKQQYLINLEKVETIASIGYSKHIYKGTQYENTVEKSSFDEITKKDCIDFFNSYYNFGEMDIFVAGKVDSSVFKLINSTFGKLETPKTVSNFMFGKNEYSPTFQFIEKKGAIQSCIRIGKPIINIDHPDYNKLKVMNTIFGGYFGSRLMANIREDKGYTYGIGSVIMAKEDMGNMIIYTEVGADVTQAAIDEIRKEIKEIQTKKVSEEELSKVKNYMLGSLLQNTDGPFDLLERYKTLYFYNLPINYYDSFMEDIKSITSEEIINLANTYLNDLSFIVAGSQEVS